MPTLEEIETKATEIAGKPIGIAAGCGDGVFGLTDGHCVVTQRPGPSDEAWDLDIEQFAVRYLMPMVNGLRAR